MIDWFYRNFPAGKNYLVCQTESEQINSFLMQRLVAPFQAGRKHNLWGKLAKGLPLIGRKIGWVPNKLPVTFLNETVELEIADADAARQNLLKPEKENVECARELLQILKLTELAPCNPFFLSEGETKMIWLLTQWAKQPEYLIIGYLPSSLSARSTRNMIQFFLEQKMKNDSHPVIILGYLADQTDWCRELLSHEDWIVTKQWQVE